MAECTNVRFGSKADIRVCFGDVRFTPKSGHNAERKNPSAHRPSSGVAVVRSESACRIEISRAQAHTHGGGKRDAPNPQI